MINLHQNIQSPGSKTGNVNRTLMLDIALFTWPSYMGLFNCLFPCFSIVSSGNDRSFHLSLERSLTPKLTRNKKEQQREKVDAAPLRHLSFVSQQFRRRTHGPVGNSGLDLVFNHRRLSGTSALPSGTVWTKSSQALRQLCIVYGRHVARWKTARPRVRWRLHA